MKNVLLRLGVALPLVLYGLIPTMASGQASPRLHYVKVDIRLARGVLGCIYI